MADSQDAVLAIRHVVQDHGDEHTLIGKGVHLPGVLWFGQLLGGQWPPTYLQVLEKHDGVMVQDAIVHSFMTSLEALSFIIDKWHQPDDGTTRTLIQCQWAIRRSRGVARFAPVSWWSS